MATHGPWTNFISSLDPKIAIRNSKEVFGKNNQLIRKGGTNTDVLGYAHAQQINIWWFFGIVCSAVFSARTNIQLDLSQTVSQ